MDRSATFLYTRNLPRRKAPYLERLLHQQLARLDPAVALGVDNQASFLARSRHEAGQGYAAIGTGGQERIPGQRFPNASLAGNSFRVGRWVLPHCKSIGFQLLLLAFFRTALRLAELFDKTSQLALGCRRLPCDRSGTNCLLGFLVGDRRAEAKPTAAASTGLMRLGSFDTAVTTMQQTTATIVGSQSRSPHTILSRANMVTPNASAGRRRN